jgi:hypothetical protein
MIGPSLITNRIRYLTARLLKGHEDAPDHAGYVSYAAPDSALDGGGYGNPFDDNKPDFIKRDDAGWI